MSWGYWEDYKRKPTRPANGIKAQTQHGKFGKTWWAGRWIAALERLVDSGRLSRGRTYARNGQVIKLDTGPKGIDAKVQGSRATPYTVSIHFRLLSDAEWENVIDRMAAEAIWAAKLLSGEMPQAIEEVFTAAGTSLFPSTTGDLMTGCSCPDWSNPCKHVAAVHYLLGERFDADPFLMFELRGRGKDAIIEALRARRSGASFDAEPPEEERVEEEAEPLVATSTASFWSLPANLAGLAMNLEPPEVDAVAVRRLGPPAFWQDQRDFMALMSQAYEIIGEHARSVILGDS
ncbi:MAG: SWIM zinc finger family protein [Dehalococcoidia bacterium]